MKDTAAHPATPMHSERTFDRKKLLMISIGTFVGSGLVSLLGVAAARTGYSVWLSYMLAVVIGFLSALPYFLMSSVMNFRGGTYTIACTFLGHQMGGAYVLLQVLYALILSIVGTGFGLYMQSVFPSVSAQYSTLAILVIFWLINCLGQNVMAGVQKYSTYILIAAMLVFCGVSFKNLNPAALDFSHPEFFLHGANGLFSAMALLVFSSQSYDNNVYAFGRYTLEPRKNMPWAIFATFLFLLVFYGICGIAAVGAVDLATFAGKPLTNVARAVFSGPFFVAFITFGPILCLTTTVNGCYAAFTIGLAKSSEDGWLPRFMSGKNRWGAHWIILTLLAAACITPVLFNIHIGILTSAATLLISLFQIPLLISFWRLPKMFPDQFKKSTLHLTVTVFQASIVIAMMARLLITYYSMRNLTWTTAAGGAAVAVVSFVFSYFRYRTGVPKVENSYFFD